MKNQYNDYEIDTLDIVNYNELADEKESYTCKSIYEIPDYIILYPIG